MPEEFHVHGAHDYALEHIAESGHANNFAGWVAVMTAILSTADAIFGYQDGAVQNAALLTENKAAIHRTKAANRRVYYRVKDQKQAVAELAAQLPGTDQAAVRHEAQRYAAEKEDIRRQAEGQERLAKGADDASGLAVHHHHRWTQAMVTIQMSIAPAAITLLSHQRWIQVLSYGVAVVGGVMAVLALPYIWQPRARSSSDKLHADMPDSQNGTRAGGTVHQESGMNAVTLRMRVRRTWMMTGLLASICVMAAGPAVEPGEYIYILGGSASGTIGIKGGSFNITTTDGNCHTCAVEDTFQGGARWHRQR